MIAGMRLVSAPAASRSSLARLSYGNLASSEPTALNLAALNGQEMMRRRSPIASLAQSSTREMSRSSRPTAVCGTST